MAVWSLSGLASPALQGIMSVQVDPAEQGELQGALSSAGGITSIVAPVALTNVFAYFTAADASVYFPGAAFLTASLCCFGALAVFVVTRGRTRTSAAPETV
jgi:DHA1 family tetracycline resistance protein-like MFS transporter